MIVDHQNQSLIPPPDSSDSNRGRDSKVTSPENKARTPGRPESGKTEGGVDDDSEAPSEAVSGQQ